MRIDNSGSKNANKENIFKISTKDELIGIYPGKIQHEYSDNK